MHDTRVELKDGRIFCAPLLKWAPSSGWMTLFGIEEKLYFKDMVSAVTEGVRSRNGKPLEQADEIERARKYMQDSRKYGWNDMTPDTPKQEWE